MHKHARAAALGMQAAHRQGKGWELHDKMFSNYRALTPDIILGYVGDIGIDVAKYKADVADPTVRNEIDQDLKRAAAAGVRGTPHFLINGRRLVGAKPFADFKRVIDEEVKKADALLAKGTPIAEVYDKLAKNQKAN